MNREMARKVADAVLYEGYMLYPYRPSSIKNRQRWTFGILYPPGYDEVRAGTERAAMHSECLLELTPKQTARIAVQLRFLHLLRRQVSDYRNGRVVPVPSLLVNGQLMESWDEGVEHSVEMGVTLPLGSPAVHHFHFAASRHTEPLNDASGQPVGQLARTQGAIEGGVTLSTTVVREGLLKLSLDVANVSLIPDEGEGRDDAMLASLLSAHTILTASGAQFVSLLEPLPELSEAVRGCRNVGNFPVLVGTAPARDMLLCSPIVLYDYPQVAPESASDFFDATEIDELLTLRVMTLTGEEKDEMRNADEHARRLLQRTEATAREQLQRTHGTFRAMSGTRGEKRQGERR